MAKKNTARASSPSTVAERRRAIRAAKEPASGPGVRRAAMIDLTKPAARKILVGIHPRPENEVYVDATPELERAALQYIEQRDVEKISKEKKEVAGNVLCNAIGKNLGLRGDGWKATWGMSKGNVDWARLAKEAGISDETIAKYRTPDRRGLDVDEVPDEG